jgi:O-antigen ligase
VLESIAIALVALWLLASLFERQILVTIPAVLMPVAGLVCWGLIQSIAISGASGERKSISMDVEASRVAVVSILFLLVLALIAANFLTGKQRLRSLSTFLVFYGMALAVFGLIQSFTWDGAFYWLRPTRATGFGPFANRDHFAGYMEMLAPFPAALIATRAIRSEQRLAYGFAGAMMIIASIASLSRGGMLSLAVEGAFLAIWTWRTKSTFRTGATARARATTSAGVSIAVGPAPAVGLFSGQHASVVPRASFPETNRIAAFLRATLPIAVFSAIGALGITWIGADPIVNRAAQTLTEINVDPGNYISRQWIWRDTWAMIRAHPITGAGIGAFETVYPMYAHNNGRAIVAQSHNDYLQVVADCGLVGAILLVFFLALLYRSARRALSVEDHQMKGVALACSAGLIGILIHSLVDFNMQIPSNALLFLFLSVVVSHVPAAAVRRTRADLHRPVEQEARVPLVVGA